MGRCHIKAMHGPKARIARQLRSGFTGNSVELSSKGSSQLASFQLAMKLLWPVYHTWCASLLCHSFLPGCQSLHGLNRHSINWKIGDQLFEPCARILMLTQFVLS